MIIYFFSSTALIVLGVIAIIGVVLTGNIIASIAPIMSIVLMSIIMIVEIIFTMSLISESDKKIKSVIPCIINGTRFFPLCQMMFFLGSELSDPELGFFDLIVSIVGAIIIIVAMVIFECLTFSILPYAIGYKPSDFYNSRCNNVSPNDDLKTLGLILSIFVSIIYWMAYYHFVYLHYNYNPSNGQTTIQNSGYEKLIILGLLTIIHVIALRRIFIKAGEAPVKAFIPFLNMYSLFKIVFGSGMVLFLLLIPYLNVVVYIIMYIKLGHKFGKSTSFIVGLVFLGSIFELIMAFDDSYYQKSH